VTIAWAGLEESGNNGRDERSQTGSGQKTQDRDLGKAAKSSDFLRFHRTAKPDFIALTRRHVEIILQRDLLEIGH
jgi:hypothetical protein